MFKIWIDVRVEKLTGADILQSEVESALHAMKSGKSSTHVEIYAKADGLKITHGFILQGIEKLPNTKKCTTEENSSYEMRKL